MAQRTLLVTGGSRGIGRAAALMAARDGWAVGVNYVRDEAAAHRVVDEIHLGGGSAAAVQGDVSSEADVVSMFDATAKALGPISGVVVNAGVVAPPAKLVDMSLERLRRVVDINLMGALLTAREAARRMGSSRGGVGGTMVFISSAAARLGSPNLYVDYAAAKGGVDTLTSGLAKELADDRIRVNAIRPGLILTDIHASGGEPDRAHTLGATAPMRRPGTAEEVAEGVVWLLSDAASYVTGAILDISGGR